MSCKLLTFIVLIMVVMPVSAQTQSVITDASTVFTNTSEGTLVRNYRDQYAVGFLIDQGTSYFYCNSIAPFSGSSAATYTSGMKMPLSYHWKVNDMQVYGDDIYFCGTDGYSHGLLGKISINDLLVAGNHAVTAYYCPIFIVSLNKLTVVDNDSYISVICIGEGASTSLDTQDVIVNVKDYSDVINTTKIALMPAVNNYHREMLQDILTVGDSVVFVGTDTRTGFNTFFARSSNKHNALNSGGINQKHYFFPTSGWTFMTQYKTRSAVVDDRYVSIAHLCENPNAGISLRINTVDVMNDMNYFSVQERLGADRSSLIEMRYLPSVKNLVLLYLTGGNTSSFLIWQPGNMTPYYTSLLYSAYSRFSSLDRLNTSSYISADLNQWYLQRTYSGSIAGACKPLNSVSIRPVEPYVRRKVAEYVNSIAYIPAMIFDNPLTTPYQLMIDCHH